jgi:predicted nuclease of predicted toxin-antitoxin system
VKILVDENIPNRTVVELRARGHDVEDVRGTPDQAVRDAGLWVKAQIGRALLITTDKGFARRSNEQHFGILIIRLRQPTGAGIHQRVFEAMRRFPQSRWAGLTVIMRDRSMTVRRARPAGGPPG